jgi:hypothetical protein
VIARLDVGERRGDARHVNNPGAEALEASLHGAEAGYPFLVILDPAGKTIVNSFLPSGRPPQGDNIGYPETEAEIDWFMKMLRQGAPAMTSGEANTIQNWLEKRGSR